MASIAFEDVSKVFPDGTRAVDGLDLEIADGEFTILVGPSGSGKSTALRMVAGLEDATARRRSRSARGWSTTSRRKDRDIAMVFQSYALYPHMSVAENMGFALKLQKVEAAIDPRRGSAAPRRGSGSASCSSGGRGRCRGGQRQRVALGRAIVRSPAGVPDGRAVVATSTRSCAWRCAPTSRALHQELGTTTLYVTHDQTEAMTMGDRVAVMRDGRLEQVDTPAARSTSSPANLFVAGFIGSPAMNLLRGVASTTTASLLGDAAAAVPRRTTYRGDVIVGIRPEALEPANGHGATTCSSCRSC